MNKKLFVLLTVTGIALYGYKNLSSRRVKEKRMNFFHDNIMNIALENTNFRKVIATGTKSQLVVMSIPVGGEIGQETHASTDQTLIFVKGQGQAILNGKKRDVAAFDAVLVPAGTQHNFINTGKEDLKLFTIYAPPSHRPTTVHATKADADKDEADHY